MPTNDDDDIPPEWQKPDDPSIGDTYIVYIDDTDTYSTVHVIPRGGGGHVSVWGSPHDTVEEAVEAAREEHDA